MIDPIAAYATGPLALLEPVPSVSLPLSMPAVSAADQVRFKSALHPPQDPSTVAQRTMTVDPLAHPAATPGDVVLRGLEHLRTRYREVGAEMESVASQSVISPQALLGLQMQVAQVTLGTQLIGQVASKLEQNLNTLLKSS